MKKENKFNLSEKRFWLELSQTHHRGIKGKGKYRKKLSHKNQARYYEKDVKEFIKQEFELLKEVYHGLITWTDFWRKRDKLA